MLQSNITEQPFRMEQISILFCRFFFLPKIFLPSFARNEFHTHLKCSLEVLLECSHLSKSMLCLCIVWIEQNFPNHRNSHWKMFVSIQIFQRICSEKKRKEKSNVHNEFLSFIFSSFFFFHRWIHWLRRENSLKRSILTNAFVLSTSITSQFIRSVLVSIHSFFNGWILFLFLLVSI